MTTRLRVVVLDNRRLVREGVRSLLARVPELDVIAAVSDISELTADIGHIDVVIEGVTSATSRITGVRHVLFTGADSLASVTDAVFRVETGATDATTHPAQGPKLTTREIAVIDGVAKGLSTGEIAESLGISRKSVDNHKQRIFAKLDVQSGTHAVVLARQAGLLDSAPDGRGLSA